MLQSVERTAWEHLEGAAMRMRRRRAKRGRAMEMLRACGASVACIRDASSALGDPGAAGNVSGSGARRRIVALPVQRRCDAFSGAGPLFARCTPDVGRHRLQRQQASPPGRQVGLQQLAHAPGEGAGVGQRFALDDAGLVQEEADELVDLAGRGAFAGAGGRHRADQRVLGVELEHAGSQPAGTGDEADALSVS